MTCCFSADYETEMYDGMAKALVDKYGVDVYDVNRFGNVIGKAVSDTLSELDLGIRRFNEAAAVAETDMVRLAHNGNMPNEVYEFVIHRHRKIDDAVRWAETKGGLSEAVDEAGAADASVLAARMKLCLAATPDEVDRLATEAVREERNRLARLERLDTLLRRISVISNR
jgi:hypothetical protein